MLELAEAEPTRFLRETQHTAGALAGFIMKVLIGYDGSDSADRALDDLWYAGLPDAAEVLVLSVGETASKPLGTSCASRVAGRT